ncbi:MAG TPA: PilN domain-containing protein [Bacillota bacterium]|mgnify:CR=1 FL=1|nr:PilN domain-containing protein [Bacillota bacterium]
MEGRDAVNDMNFFSSYNKKSEKKGTGKSTAIIRVISVLIFVAVFSIGIYNFFIIKKLKNEVQYLNAELNVVMKDPRLPEIMDKKRQISDYKEKLSKIAALDRYIESLDIVNEYMLEDIRSNMPSELFLKSMVMTQDGVKAEGVSKDKDSIAQFGYNLSKIMGLEKVFVPQITDEEDCFAFYLDIDLKEEKKDGAKAKKQ